MSNIKELIIGAITVMSDDEANKLWNVILKNIIKIGKILKK